MSENKDPFPNKDFREYEFERADMTNAYFNGVNLSCARFWAVVEEGRFNDSNLRKSTFNDVNLEESIYENVNLNGARYNNVNLANSSFSNLNLSNVEISDANLQGTRINGVLVSELFEAWEKSR
ncbi:MAG: pentapeptide repeat-containing protein [Granulosicoccus sp.]